MPGHGRQLRRQHLAAGLRRAGLGGQPDHVRLHRLAQRAAAGPDRVRSLGLQILQEALGLANLAADVLDDGAALGVLGRRLSLLEAQLEQLLGGVVQGLIAGVLGVQPDVGIDGLQAAAQYAQLPGRLRHPGV